jgi:hypothetical protein
MRINLQKAKGSHPMKYSLSAISLIIALAGCSDDGNKGDPAKRQGRLLFSGIDGLTYQTATLSGAVNPDGSFSYHEGETITFWLGDLLLTEGVPAREYLTPLEFTIEGRTRLETGDVINGFTTHALAEIEVSLHQVPNNITRFLQLMDKETSQSSVDGIPITIDERAIEQMNEQLMTLVTPINFDVPITDFEKYIEPEKFVEGVCPTPTGETPEIPDFPEAPETEDPVTPPVSTTEEDSPVNKLLTSICFYPEGHFTCEPPPSQAEIDCAPKKFDEEGVLLEGIDETLENFYKEDLIDTRESIISSKTKTKVKSSNATRETILFEASSIAEALGARLLFSRYGETVNEGDNAERTVSILSETGDFVIADMEIESLNETIVRVDRFSMAEKTFTYTPVGVAGEETTIVLNIRVEGDYRWYLKNYRVIIK